MYCWICENFSEYTSYLELVCAGNGLLGAWWAKFRQQALVDRTAEQSEHELLQEKGSDAGKRVAATFDSREKLDRRTRRAGWICAVVIVVLTLASLLLIKPSTPVPTCMKVMFVSLPFVLPAIIAYALIRNRILRRKGDDIILADLKERRKAESELPQTHGGA